MLFTFPNVSLLNGAASDKTNIFGIDIPDFNTGLKNFYEAKLSGNISGIQVMAIPLDALCIPHCVKLAKIDVE